MKHLFSNIFFSLAAAQAAHELYMHLAIGLVPITSLLVGLFRLNVSKNLALTRQQTLIHNRYRKLEQMLQEKERLMKEVHHRVKNNFQIVASLLNSQSMYVGEGAAYEAMQDSEARVQSMAMIHQKLYTAPGLLSIDLPDYITDLVNCFRLGYDGRQRTKFLLDISPAVADVSVAVPLALILNEAITNSLKYAFPDCRPGTIRIWMKPKNETEQELGIADNGTGFSPELLSNNRSSFGINLIHGLTQDIGGQCIIENRNGMVIRIIFPKRTLLSPLNPESVQLSVPGC